MTHVSRRDFIKTSAVAAGAAVAAPGISRAAASTGIAVTPPLSVFSYSQVRLLEGAFREQFDQNHDLFLHLDEDAMLKPFRQREGLAAPGPDMGGWYDNSNDFDSKSNFHGFVPGHSFGQYLSGLSRAYAVTGSRATQEKVHRLVRGFGETVEPAGKFYVDCHLPAYTYDKTSCGLIDAHEFAKCPDALDVHRRATSAVLPFLPAKALSRKEQYERPHKMEADAWDETYTLPENLFLAYQRSGDPRYRELAVRFIEKEYFDPLAEQQNVLVGEHAYSHVNAFSSAMQAYLVLGDEKYLRAATNGLRFVHEQSFATGGWGPNEAFVEPGKGLLAASLKSTHSSFETPCGAYAHFKITRYLLRVTRDSRYGDSMERILYNTIAGATPILADGTSFYYSDYNVAGKKGHHLDKWPCCSGTFPQLTADYGISSYYRGADGVYVNLFLPSTLTWMQDKTRCTLTQKTEYPRAGTTQLALALDRPETFTVYVRIPAWAGAKTRVSVNGTRSEGEIEPGKFLEVKRAWKNGDRVDVEFDMTARLEAVDAQNPNQVALLRGPLALFAVGEMPARLSRQQLLAAVQVARSSDDWAVETGKAPMTLRPFASIMAETYRLYQQVEG